MIRAIQKLIWAPAEERKKLQSHGFNIVPLNFYSNTPSIEDIEQSFEYTETAPPYLNPKIFKAELMRQWLQELVEYSHDFNPPIKGNEETCENGYFWENSQFSYSDAMSHYAMLRRLKPKRVVEIGSGFSSLVTLAALKANGSGSLTCIEPFPRPFLKKLAEENQISLLLEPAQNISPEKLNSMLDDGDVLFIDSTHTVKTGSDCLHIYLRILPSINHDIFVHVHDIFLPYGLPQKWMLDLQIHWTEQHLLLALITDNPRISVLYGSTYHKNFNNDLLQKLMHDRFPTGGGSFWFEYSSKT